MVLYIELRGRCFCSSLYDNDKKASRVIVEYVVYYISILLSAWLCDINQSHEAPQPYQCAHSSQHQRGASSRQRYHKQQVQPR